MTKNKIRLALVNFWQYPAQTPHFGLISLAAYIREKMPDINIKIVEGLDPGREIIRFKPDMIGFTVIPLLIQRPLSKLKF